MLWFDNNTKLNINQRLLRAVEYCNNKYNYYPSEILVSEKMEDFEYPDVKITKVKYILPNHFFLVRN